MIHRCRRDAAGAGARWSPAPTAASAARRSSCCGRWAAGCWGRCRRSISSFSAQPGRRADCIARARRWTEAGTQGLVPDGVDVALDGLGGSGTAACIRATRRGGPRAWATDSWPRPRRAGFEHRRRRGAGWRRCTSARGCADAAAALHHAGLPSQAGGRSRWTCPSCSTCCAAPQHSPAHRRQAAAARGRPRQQLLEAGGLEGRIVLSRDVAS